MTYLRHVLLVFLVSMLLAPAAASADQGRGRGNGNGHGAERAAKARDKADVVVIDRDGHRRVVREYYTQQALPPGLARREALPPRLEKKLRRRGRKGTGE